MKALTRNSLLVGDALDQLRELPDESADMVLTSPPYFRLRDYGVAGQLGAETDVESWVEHLLAVLQETRRVLRVDGTLWLNLGDSYSTHLRQGAPRKSLLLGPDRLALRLIKDGWRLRNRIVWEKTNARPSPMTDRLSTRHELVYLLSRSDSYHFDLHAIRQAHRTPTQPSRSRPGASLPEAWRGPNAVGTDGLSALRAQGRPGHALGKNPGDVWRLPTGGYRGAHFAVFPLRLAERAIRAGCPARRCQRCDAAWRTQLVRSVGATAVRGVLGPGCGCGQRIDSSWRPGLVLDPFMGAGTTAVAAEALGRDWLGIELNPSFARDAETRIDAARRQRDETRRAA